MALTSRDSWDASAHRSERVVVALAVHPRENAATRLRLLQFSSAMADAGLELRFWSFIRDSDEASWLAGNWRHRLPIVIRGMCRLGRLVSVVRGANVVVVQREAVPFGPAIVELLARRGRKLVWDVDDCLWRHHTSVAWCPRWLRSTGEKYRRLAIAADEVWAGSEVLAAWCRQCNGNVHVVPTVVDVPPLPRAVPGRHTVTWIGSPTTAPFVAEILPALAGIKTRPRVLVVGGRLPAPDGLDAEVLPWSAEAESRALAEATIGLYPVDRRHVLAEGKCGLKAILYMAHGVVPVVTPTTTNAQIVHDGVRGVHAEGDAEWAAVITRLLVNHDEWERLRETGYAFVRDHYSLSVWAPRVVSRLQHLVGDGSG